MLRQCCQKSLYIGFDLKTSSVNCGECRTSWTREEGGYTWTGSDGSEVDFSPDEQPKKLEPEKCCLDVLDHAMKHYYCITNCPCGIKWSRPTARALNWSAYKQEAVA